MTRFIEINYRSGSVNARTIINVASIVQFNADKNQIVCDWVGEKRTLTLSPESTAAVREVLFVNNLSDPIAMIAQMQRDLDAYKSVFINVLGWANGMFRDGKAVPAIGLFPDVTADINNQMSSLMTELSKLNSEYQDMKEKLMEVCPDYFNHGVDPDNQ